MAEDVVDTFYMALADRDGEAMAACYADDIVFEDPAFGVLNGRDAGDMWRMLCSRSTDLRVEYTIRESTDSSATIDWVADYAFGTTGRSVRNEITAHMKLRDDLIVDHRDQFDLWKWSAQALGLPGRLLGWSPPLKKKVRSTALDGLAAFQAAQA
jgi:limonene-1,2-epoxide hydrolase